MTEKHIDESTPTGVVKFERFDEYKKVRLLEALGEGGRVEIIDAEDLGGIVSGCLIDVTRKEGQVQITALLTLNTGKQRKRVDEGYYNLRRAWSVINHITPDPNIRLNLIALIKPKTYHTILCATPSDDNPYDDVEIDLGHQTIEKAKEALVLSEGQDQKKHQDALVNASITVRRDQPLDLSGQVINTDITEKLNTFLTILELVIQGLNEESGICPPENKSIRLKEEFVNAPQ